MIVVSLIGCVESSLQEPLAEAWPAVPVEVLAKVQVPAFRPTDVLVRPEGGAWVLDGDRGRIVPIAADGAVGAPFGTPEAWGHPVRLAPAAAGGAWLVDPAGRLIELDAAGKTVRQLTVAGVYGPDQVTDGPAPPTGPVAAVEVGDALVVSDRHGRLVWLALADGAVRTVIDRDPEDVRLATVTDLALAADGALLAADAVAARVHRIGADQTWTSFGRFGQWIGTLRQPKAVLAEGAGVWVADSALGAVQLFAADGSARGVLTLDGEPLALPHPIALDREADGDLLVLEAETATVWTVRPDRAALDAALAQAPPRWQRKALADEHGGPAGVDGRNCLQCHDGLVNDGRKVWDPERGHHPVHERPEHAVPAFFPVDEDGGLMCVTCHSPHGSSSLADVEAVQGGADPDLLVRHAATEPFLRLERNNAALCVACHTEAPHEDAVGGLGLGSAHPTGAALAAKVQDNVQSGSCLTCHAVHGAEGEPLLRGEADGQLCVGCHEAEAAPGRSHPLGPASPAAGAHLPLDRSGRTTCRTCHDLAGGGAHALLRLPQDGGALCAACHADHAQGHGVRGCDSCHDPHDAAFAATLTRALGARTDADPNGCLGCHAPGKAAAAPGVSPGRAGHPVDGQVHGPGADPLPCGTCHDTHDPGEAPACGTCHTDEHAAAQRGGHGSAACADCHPPHAAGPQSRRAGINPRAAPCVACHVDRPAGDPARAPAPLASWTHPDLVFRPDGARWTPLAGLPLFGPDGAELPAGQNGELTCASCHVTHGPDPAEPGDSLRRPGWKEVCTSCHGPEALVLYRYFHQPDRRSPEAP